MRNATRTGAPLTVALGQILESGSRFSHPSHFYRFSKMNARAFFNIFAFQILLSVRQQSVSPERRSLHSRLNAPTGHVRRLRPRVAATTPGQGNVSRAFGREGQSAPDIHRTLGAVASEPKPQRCPSLGESVANPPFQLNQRGGGAPKEMPLIRRRGRYGSNRRVPHYCFSDDPAANFIRIALEDVVCPRVVLPILRIGSNR